MYCNLQEYQLPIVRQIIVLSAKFPVADSYRLHGTEHLDKLQWVPGLCRG